MKKEEQFYTDRSDLVSSLIDYMKLCKELGRDVEEELDEVICEAREEIKFK